MQGTQEFSEQISVPGHSSAQALQLSSVPSVVQTPEQQVWLVSLQVQMPPQPSSPQ